MAKEHVCASSTQQQFCSNFFFIFGFGLYLSLRYGWYIYMYLHTHLTCMKCLACIVCCCPLHSPFSSLHSCRGYLRWGGLIISRRILSGQLEIIYCSVFTMLLTAQLFAADQQVWMIAYELYWQVHQKHAMQVDAARWAVARPSYASNWGCWLDASH